MEPVQVDRGEDVPNPGSGNVELGQQFDLAAGNGRINVEFSRYRDEILLKYLQRHNACPRAPMLRYEIEGSTLLHRRRLVVRVDEDVRVEEATSAHESRRD